jgi:hypothetical protein
MTQGFFLKRTVQPSVGRWIRATAILFCLFQISHASAGEPRVSGITKDETIVFFPAYGCRAPGGATWTADIRAWVYEPERDSRKREVLFQQVRRALGLKSRDTATDLFRTRAWPFIVDSERGKQISIWIGNRLYPLGATAANGHVVGVVQIAPDEAARLIRAQDSAGGWLSFRARLAPSDRRQFHGTIQLLEDAGVSVVSDIDDTIKVTEIQNRQELLANTFLREFRPVPGMAGVFERWAKSGAAFHYLSAGPWQLHGVLTEFLEQHGFPAGSLYMRAFRWKDTDFFSLFSAPDRHKHANIEPIIRSFPHRRFMFVGDSGEQDPEIYGAFGRKYPNQVAAIYIRDVTGEKPKSARYSQAFRGIPPDRWRLFSAAEDLPLALP